MSESYDAMKLYLKDLSNLSFLTQEEEIKLAKSKDRESKNKLVESNLKLVFTVAAHYKNRGIDFQDLIQEGNLGLIHAAEKFEVERGYRFCTYAVWWIKQYIVRAISNQGKAIRIPVHMVENIDKIKIANRDLSQELGRKPTDKEIAKKTSLSIEQIKTAKEYMIGDLISIDKFVGEREDATVGDLIEDEYYIDPAITYEQEESSAIIKNVLSTLSKRESDIIKKRFGLEDGKTKTLEDLGEEYELTKERIRQIEAKALRKLRHPSRANLLKGCYIG